MLLLFLSILVLGTFVKGLVGAVSVDIAVLSPRVLSVTEPTYASWNIDSSCNRGFHHINFTNKNLLAAARGLQPSKLRFGGSGDDNLVYGLSEGSPECSGVPQDNCSGQGYINPGCLNATHWNNLHDFAVNSQSDFIFGVAYGLEQACKLGQKYEWNSTNAISLLDYIAAHSQTVWAFEFGNEVNNNGPGTACNQSSAQQAHGQQVLRQLVERKVPQAVLIGPDTGYREAENWLKEFLPFVSPRLHAITHHVYNSISRSNFNSVAQLDSSLPEITWYTALLREQAPDSQVWAGENGPTGGGPDGTCGRNSACGTYATTLWYADDLALRAKHGFVQYQRQDLFGGYYGLTNSKDMAQSLGPDEPLDLRPDYWINFMWKRTIGRNVLNATSSQQELRAYAFSGTPASPYSEDGCKSSTLQLLLINLLNATVSIDQLPGNLTYKAWVLSPANGPFSSSALLNNVKLPTTVNTNSILNTPAFLQKIQSPALQISSKVPLSLPGFSVAFLCAQPSHNIYV